MIKNTPHHFIKTPQPFIQNLNSDQTMASQRNLATAIFLALLASTVPSAADPTAPPPPRGCTGRLLLLLPCLPFAQGTALLPSPACCHVLATLFISQPDCACAALHSAAISFPVNATLARKLPLACRLAADPEACDVAASPAASAPPAAAALAAAPPAGAIFNGGQRSAATRRSAAAGAVAFALWAAELFSSFFSAA
ncbi:non-specific lipid transfer protein GPI-anchored 14-like [Wolffia australiana]